MILILFLLLGFVTVVLFLAMLITSSIWPAYLFLAIVFLLYAYSFYVSKIDYRRPQIIEGNTYASLYIETYKKYSMFIHNPFASEELLGAGNIVRFGMIPFALYFVFHSLWYYLIILIGFFIFGLFAIDWHLFYPYTKNNIMYEQTGNPMYHNLNSEIETLMNEIYY